MLAIQTSSKRDYVTERYIKRKENNKHFESRDPCVSCGLIMELYQNLTCINELLAYNLVRADGILGILVPQMPVKLHKILLDNTV